MWNHDISAAPRGYFISEEKPKQYQVEHVWLALSNGKVRRSLWDPTLTGGAGWRGLEKTDVVIAWQRFVVPAHPFQEREAVSVKPDEDFYNPYAASGDEYNPYMERP